MQRIHTWFYSLSDNYIVFTARVWVTYDNYWSTYVRTRPIRWTSGKGIQFAHPHMNIIKN